MNLSAVLRYGISIFIFALFSLFMASLSPVQAQYNLYFSGHVVDNAGHRYNQYHHNPCNPTYYGVDFSFGPNIRSVDWVPCPQGQSAFIGDFKPSAPPGSTETMTISIPPTFSCATTTWTVTNTANNTTVATGSGCSIPMPKPTASGIFYLGITMGLPPPTPTPTPNVCLAPPVPTNVFISCQGANRLTLQWDMDGWGHYIRINSLNDPFNWNPGICPPATNGPGDHCATVGPGGNTYTFIADPNTTYTAWIHSYNVCNAVSGAVAAMNNPTCSIDCGNVTSTSGSYTLYPGMPANFTAQYTTVVQPADAQLVYVRGGVASTIMQQPLGIGYNQPINAGWIPQASDVGTGNICCRVTNNPYAQCTGAADNPPASPQRYSCPSANTCRVVNVVAINEWYKLANASLHKKGNFNVVIPNTIETYDDQDDTTEQYIIIGNAGVITSDNPTMTILSDTGETSMTDWKRPNFTEVNNFLDNLNEFVTYAKTRKKVKLITSASQMDDNTINIITGNYTINSAAANRIPNSVNNAVLIVSGNLRIAPQAGGLETFNPSKRSLAIIATGNIELNSNYTELNGIFIAQRFDLAYDLTAPTKSTNPLKIRGNLISRYEMDDYAMKRKRTNYNQPSLFIVLDANMYIDLLPHLSTISQEGRQIQ